MGDVDEEEQEEDRRMGSCPGGRSQRDLNVEASSLLQAELHCPLVVVSCYCSYLRLLLGAVPVSSQLKLGLCFVFCFKLGRIFGEFIFGPLKNVALIC